MIIRKVTAGRGAGWITDGIKVFSSQPRAYVLACLIIGVISSLPLVGILIGLVMPVFYGGLLSLLRRQATGGVASPGQAFDGFQQPGALGRLLPIVLINLALAVVVVVAVVAVIGTVVYQMIQSGQSIETHPELLLPYVSRFVMLLLVLMPIAILFGWILMLAIPHAMLDDVPGLAALGDAWSAVLANIAPLLVNLICLIIIMGILMLIMIVPLLTLGMLQQHSTGFGLLLQIPIAAAFTAGILMIYCAIMYQAWLEIFGPETTTVANDQVML